MATTLDLMEYANDVAAQAAFVTNGIVDSYTNLLLHGDGDGATIIDEAGKTVTVVGNTTQSATQSKFGGKSIYFDGNGDYLTALDSDDWSFGAGDFTIDFWFWSGASGNKGFCGQGTDGNNCWQFDIYSGKIYFYAAIGGSLKASYNYAWTYNDSQWYHIALVRSGTSLFLFIDGVSQTLTVASAIGTNDLGNVAAVFNIGYAPYDDVYLNGYMEEFRVSKGVARWTSNFTPPTAAYAKVLQGYSEATIKQEGSYALKGIAAIPGSLNKTLTRAVSPTIDLSNKTIIRFDMRASRTGANIKIGIHDSGGTTTEITPTIATADTWQTVVWDISAVSNANKDAIDSIIVTIVNADAANTFYIDNMFADVIQNFLIHRGRDRFRTAGYSLG